MVDRADLDEAARLNAEYARIDRAIQFFNQGGIITSLTVSDTKPPADGVPQFGLPGLAIDTTRIDYPPQMVDAIKAALTARQDDILSELSNFGVTGASR